MPLAKGAHVSSRRILFAAVISAASLISAGSVEAQDKPPTYSFEGSRRPGESVPTGQYANVPGVHLWYLDQAPQRNGRDRHSPDGHGEAVIFLHANTGTSESWLPQLEAFSKAGYRAIAFDRRGWGKSMADPATGAQPGSVTEDLHALVTYLRLARFHLVGVAGGGFVAMDYASWHGERLFDLVIAASTGSIAEPAITDFSARIAIPGLNAMPVQYREVGASYRGANPEGLAAWVELEEHAQQAGAPSQPLRTPNTFAKLQTITQRTLVIPGDADLIAPPGLMRVWAPYVRRAEWTLVPDAGHALNTEQPEIFNDSVLKFLGGYRFERVNGGHDDDRDHDR
jgi:pimeloyl-ACP methyl ester carboxylesterase